MGFAFRYAARLGRQVVMIEPIKELASALKDRSPSNAWSGGVTDHDGEAIFYHHRKNEE